MKNKIRLSLALVLGISFLSANAQTITINNNGTPIVLAKDTQAKMILFTAKYLEGKTYLHWDVAAQKDNGVYIIYRSTDGESYEVIGSKRGVGVQVCFPVAYYYRDEKPVDGRSYYKVIHYGMDKTYLSSVTVEVNIDRTVSLR